MSHGYNWEELEHFQMPDPQKEGMFFDFDKKVPGYRQKDYAYVALQYYGPLEKLENIRGFENAMADMKALTCTPEAVREGVRRTVQLLWQHGRMVCAAVNIMDDVPLKNFEALVEGIKEYRYLYSK